MQGYIEFTAEEEAEEVETDKKNGWFWAISWHGCSLKYELPPVKSDHTRMIFALQGTLSSFIVGVEQRRRWRAGKIDGDIPHPCWNSP